MYTAADAAPRDYVLTFLFPSKLAMKTLEERQCIQLRMQLHVIMF